MALFQVVHGANIVGGGRGMIATQEIAKGALILQENALVVCPTDIRQTQWAPYINTFYQNERDRTTNHLSQAVATLTPADRQSFNRLFRPPPTGTPLNQLVSRFEYNAFEFSGRDRKAQLAVYQSISFINHSCIPNATIEIWRGRTQHPQGQARLVAATTIPAGSEILLTYIADHWLDISVIRRNALQTHWRFPCACEGCAPLQAQMDAEERNAARGYYTNLMSAVPPITPLQLHRHIDRLCTYIRLLGALGVWDDKLSGACLILAQCHLQQSDFLRAKNAAIAGLYVEEHAYDKQHTNELQLIIGQCHVRDESLRAEYNRATLGPYPLF